MSNHALAIGILEQFEQVLKATGSPEEIKAAIRDVECAIAKLSELTASRLRTIVLEFDQTEKREADEEQITKIVVLKNSNELKELLQL
jgi:uncharacterized protein YdeI (YjbR/CyaY-like superfamily)